MLSAEINKINKATIVSEYLKRQLFSSLEFLLFLQSRLFFYKPYSLKIFSKKKLELELIFFFRQIKRNVLFLPAGFYHLPVIYSKDSIKKTHIIEFLIWIFSDISNNNFTIHDYYGLFKPVIQDIKGFCYKEQINTAYIIDLKNRNQYEIFSRFKDSVKNQIRQAESLEYRTVNKSDIKKIKKMHSMYAKGRKNKNFYKKKFFKDIIKLSQFGNILWLVAIKDSLIIATSIFLFSSEACYYFYNLSLPKYRYLRPNNGLLWRGILEAQARKCDIMNLGVVPLGNKGLANFKKGFGAKKYQYSSFIFLDKKDSV